MKTKLYLFLFCSSLLLCFVNVNVLYGAIDNIELSKISSYVNFPTMYVEANLISSDIEIKDCKSDIEYVSSGSNLYIYLDEDLKKDYKIELRLENAEWFFRSSQNYSNTSESSLAIENYEGEITEYLTSNYILRNGIFIPSSKLSKTGIYHRKGSYYEPSYKLYIKNMKDADLILEDGAKKGDCIVVPLVTKTLGYKDASINIKIGSFMENLVFTTYNKSNNVIKTKTYVNNYSQGNKEFILDDIKIDELYLGSIKSGKFELICPNGYIFVPNSDNFNIDSRDILNLKENKQYIINVELRGGLEWANGKYKTGEGERDKDYKIDYINYGPRINKSGILIELNNISKSKDIKGSVIIKGLKLLNMENAYDEEIYLSIRNMGSNKIITNEDFKVADNVNYNGLISNYEIEEKIVESNNESHILKDIPSFINIDNYDIDSLLKNLYFQKKKYISGFDNNTIRPDEYVMRGEVAQMLYNLLANQEITYKNPFLDCNNISTSNAIGFCFSKGYIDGYEDKTFRPNKTITRGEIAVILNNILDIKSNYYSNTLLKDHWAYNAVSNLIYNGIITGYPDGTFKENNNVTRAEIIVMINKAFSRGNIFNKNIKEFSDLRKDHWAYGYIMNAFTGYDDN